MDNISLSNKWKKLYQIVPEQLQKIKNVKRVATAFNTNIDAVVKIKGAKIAELINHEKMTIEDLSDKRTQINSGKDVLRGVVKCFTQGIAEEWLCEDARVFDWLKDNIGYNHLQMGGQGGIVANTMAIIGVQNVYVHTASHPKLQAEQFLDLPNLQAADSKGNWRRAHDVNRSKDIPLVHWIIEFDVGDKVIINGREIICPKSNRFIATYDSDNMVLKEDEGFLKNLDETGFDYMILSGYHNLTINNNGIDLIKKNLSLIKKWKINNPQAVIHLELASTQDKKVRKAIMDYIAPLADSIGLNEREALDVLEIINNDEFNKIKNEKLNTVNLFEVLVKIKKYCHVPRIQLHFFGMYLTLQDVNFKITPEQNRDGMMLAATIAASKAGTGNINDYNKLLWAHGKKISDIGLTELAELAHYINRINLSQNGICTLEDINVIAIPTILLEKPLTLVGMGDTISSVSLIGAL